MALTSLLWVLGASQTLSGESLFVFWELVMWTTPDDDGTTVCPARPEVPGRQPARQEVTRQQTPIPQAARPEVLGPLTAQF